MSLSEIERRVEEIVHEHFYSGPISGSAARLAKALVPLIDAARTEGQAQPVSLNESGFPATALGPAAEAHAYLTAIGIPWEGMDLTARIAKALGRSISDERKHRTEARIPLEAEVERLRSVLTGIALFVTSDEDTQTLVDHARLALGSDQKGGKDE